MLETAAERRRRRARLEISRIAVRLFAERGYAATSTEQVAAAADVSRSTLFRHFPDKEELVFGVEDDLLLAARAAVVQATPGRTPWQALRHATVALAAEVTELREVLLKRERVIATSTALQARAAAKHRRWEGALTRALQDGYQHLNETDAGLLAKLAVACFEAAERQWVQERAADLAGLVDAAFARLPRLTDGEEARP